MWWWKLKEPPPAGTKEARELGCTCEVAHYTGRAAIRCAMSNGGVAGFEEAVPMVKPDPRCSVHGPIARKLAKVEREVRINVLFWALLLGYALSRLWRTF